MCARGSRGCAQSRVAFALCAPLQLKNDFVAERRSMEASVRFHRACLFSSLARSCSGSIFARVRLALSWRAEPSLRRPSFACCQKREAQLLREERWKSKMERSPFHVDLVAEQERIDEVSQHPASELGGTLTYRCYSVCYFRWRACRLQENRMRLREEARRQKLIEKRKEEVKKEIILQVQPHLHSSSTRSVEALTAFMRAAPASRRPCPSKVTWRRCGRRSVPFSWRSVA